MAERHLTESTLAVQAQMSQETSPMLSSHLGLLTTCETVICIYRCILHLHQQDLTVFLLATAAAVSFEDILS